MIKYYNSGVPDVGHKHEGASAMQGDVQEYEENKQVRLKKKIVILLHFSPVWTEQQKLPF